MGVGFTVLRLVMNSIYSLHYMGASDMINKMDSELGESIQNPVVFVFADAPNNILSSVLTTAGIMTCPWQMF